MCAWFLCRVTAEEECTALINFFSMCGPNELIFTCAKSGDVEETVRAPIIRQLQQKGAETEVLLVLFNNRPFVVKFTTKRDVEIHKTLFENEITRDDVVRLVSSVPQPHATWPSSVARVVDIKGSNSLRRRPWKLMQYVDEVEERAGVETTEISSPGKRRRTDLAAAAAATARATAAAFAASSLYSDLVRRVVSVVPELRKETDWKSPKNILWMRGGKGGLLLLPRVFDFD